MTTKKPSHKQMLPLATILALSLILATSNILLQQAMAYTSYDVSIFDLSFSPEVRCIEKGDTVVWSNNDTVIHTLWFVFAENDSTYLLSDPIPPDDSWSHTFNEFGKLVYYDFGRLWITGKLRIYPIFGDVNFDNIVDGADFSRMGKAYRATPGDDHWDEDCDINGDGIVDGADFSIAGKNYRKTDP